MLADDGRAPLKSSASPVAAIMLLATKVAVDEVPKTPTLRAGVVAVIGIFGLAWLGDSFIAANKDI
jgi:anaerobic C4-dicarboxylate transporter DcuA